MAAKSFNENAEDNGHHAFTVPENMSPRQAMRQAVDSARLFGWSSVEFKIYGLSIVLGNLDLAGLEKDSAAYGSTAAQKSYLMRELSAMTAFALPKPASALAASYPFTSKALDDFLNAAHNNADPSMLKEKLTGIQGQYIGYLFDTLVKASRDQASDLFNECCKRIFRGVLDHTSNSRAYLTDERKTLLIEEMTTNGLMTDDREQIIRQAGLPQNRLAVRDRSPVPA
jgi:hypothetical protein